MKIFMIISALMIGLIAIVPWTRSVPSASGAIQYALGTEPATFIERTKGGEQIVHKFLHASIQVPATDEVPKLEHLARQMMDHSIKSEAEKQGVDMVWLTFHRLDNRNEIQEKVKTYRVIYTRRDGNWSRLERAKEKGA